LITPPERRTFTQKCENPKKAILTGKKCLELKTLLLSLNLKTHHIQKATMNKSIEELLAEIVESDVPDAQALFHVLEIIEDGSVKMICTTKRFMNMFPSNKGYYSHIDNALFDRASVIWRNTEPDDLRKVEDQLFHAFSKAELIKHGKMLNPLPSR
jgi:hypothetical protein